MTALKNGLLSKATLNIKIYRIFKKEVKFEINTLYYFPSPKKPYV